MRIISPAFEHGLPIPKKYGRIHQNVNPPLEFHDVPNGVKSLILLMEDPDAPEAAGVPVWDHWVVFDIPPDIGCIPENWSARGVMRGAGTRGELTYGGPKPPDREHRYFFKLFALDRLLDLSEGAKKSDVLQAAQGHILASAELMGTYAPD